jgi:hypothetical protein
MRRPRERRHCCVVTIAVGGDGNIGPESVLLWLICWHVGWAGGCRERRVVGLRYKH